MGGRRIGPSCLFWRAQTQIHGCAEKVGQKRNLSQSSPRKAALGAERKLVTLKRRMAGLSAAMLKDFVRRARRVVGLKGTVDVLVTGSSEMRVLNRRFGGRDKPTDVLSFPALAQIEGGKFAGDVAVCADIAARNALRLGHSAVEELKILTLHGVLHLAGYDHESDNGRMARKESKLRRELGLPTGLIERNQQAGTQGLPVRRPRASSRAVAGSRRPR
jgi:probable rRNA maturation factor